ncbi:hypothetical protein ACOME3_009198 [Neoechinorhynchus agilis]
MDPNERRGWVPINKRNPLAPTTLSSKEERCAQSEYEIIQSKIRMEKVSRNLQSCLLSVDQAHKDINVLEERLLEQDKMLTELKRSYQSQKQTPDPLVTTKSTGEPMVS